MTSEFSEKLLSWYDQNKRTLPWRDVGDAYAVWVSEIMLQQTRVETVIPYFQRWMTAFPTLADLANAPLEQVLRLWEGLGYYARARNLHKAAQQVQAKFAGQLPTDPPTLQSLPGIGRYTAGAIASIAYGQKAPILDGNVKRVLARVFNVGLPANRPSGTAALWQLSTDLLPDAAVGDYNQALMDLGATVCTPQNPTCLLCPVQSLCQAYRLQNQKERPVMIEKAPLPHYDVTAGIIWKDGRVLLAQRPPEKLLGGLWEFPGGKTEPGENLPDCLQREIREELACEIAVGTPIASIKHAFTHFRITVHFFDCQWVSGEPQALDCADWRWVALDALADYPMGKVDRIIAKQLAAEKLKRET